MCGTEWALLVVTVMGVVSGEPKSRLLVDGLPSKQACMELRVDLRFIEVGQRFVCVPRNVR